MQHHLFDGLQDLFEIELVVQPLHCGDALTAVALLHADVHKVLLVDIIIGLLFAFKVKSADASCWATCPADARMERGVRREDAGAARVLRDVAPSESMSMH